MRELLYPLRRLRFALRMGAASFRLGWQVHVGIHAEAQRVAAELQAGRPLSRRGIRADKALYDDVLSEAGSGILRRTFDE